MPAGRRSGRMRPTRYGAFGYPLAGKGRERPLVACWILLMLGVLVPVLSVVPLAVVLGYLGRVVDASARGESTPRFLREPGTLLRWSAGGLLVVVGYLLVPVLALGVTVYGATTTAQGPDLGSTGTLVVYGGSTAVLCLFGVALYLVPAALAVYADRSLGAAFSRQHLAAVVGHAAYFPRWMAGTVALSMAAAFGSVALQIHRVGPIVASLVGAYGAIFAAHLWGLGVRRARERR